MTNQDLVAGVFVTEWAQLASSSLMRRALRRWRTESNGLITATSPDELLKTIKSCSDLGTSIEVATWLLATADPMATRILVQATQSAVMTSIRNAKMGRADLAEYANSCVASLFLAVDAIAGTQEKWTIWSIRWHYRREVSEVPVRGERISLRPLPSQKERSGQQRSLNGIVDFDFDTTALADEPRRCDVELSRLLLDAVKAGEIPLHGAQMLWLHTIGGMSYAELSAERGIKVSSIRKDQARFIKRVGRYAESAAA